MKQRQLLRTVWRLCVEVYPPHGAEGNHNDRCDVKDHEQWRIMISLIVMMVNIK